VSERALKTGWSLCVVAVVCCLVSWKVVQQKLTVCVWARWIIMRRSGVGRNTAYISVLYRKWDTKTVLLVCYWSLFYLANIVCAFPRCCVVCMCMWTVCWVGYVKKISEPTGIGSWYLSDKIMTLFFFHFFPQWYRASWYYQSFFIYQLMHKRVALKRCLNVNFKATPLCISGK
jgi:hypothetical protein